MEHDDGGIELVDFHEEIFEDIKEKLNYLDDSYDCLEKLIHKTITNRKFRSEIDSDVGSFIEIANEVKLTMESIFLPQYSTSIPFLKDLRKWLICLIVNFYDLRIVTMEGYESRVMYKLKTFLWEVIRTNAKKDLSIEMFLSMKDFTPPTTTTTADEVYEEDFELIATMKKVVKERHEEMMKIEKRMIELEQVLFEMYVMVQKQLINNTKGNDDDDDDDEEYSKMMKIHDTDTVENLVWTIWKADRKRELAKYLRTLRRIGLVAQMLLLFVFGCVCIFCSGWFRGWMTGYTDQSRFINWLYQLAISNCNCEERGGSSEAQRSMQK